MKKFVLTAAAFCSMMVMQAQFTYDYLKAADNYFRKGDYYSAAQYYEKYLGAGKATKASYNPYVVQGGAKKGAAPVSSREQAVYNAAESYRLLNYPSKANEYYGQAVGFDHSQFPLALFWYASTQRALANYQEAEKNFASFLNEYKTDDKYTEMARRELANLQFIQKELGRKDINLFTIAPAGGSIADTGAVYAPVWTDAQTLMVTATRPDATEKNASYVNSMYRVSYAGGVAGAMEKIEIPQPKEVHQGVASFTPDGNTVFLTRWTLEGGNKKAALYQSRKGAAGWSEPVLMDASVNASGSNTQQPFITSDGKTLLFASDRAGGLGGFDIWVADLSAEGNVSNIRNAGEAINTKYDEQAPYHHPASNTLVFSSNGRVGMGGMDFFFAKGAVGNWSTAQNFGHPVNSVKDDLYFASRGSSRNILEDVLLSSDRSAACCLQLFSLKKANVSRQVNGLVVSCETGSPIAGATVQIVDPSSNKTVITKTTDASGQYSLTLEAFQPLKAVASTSGYNEGSLSFDGSADETLLTLSNPNLCLTKIPEVGTKEVMDNVYYEFSKAIVLEESFAALDRVVEYLIENPTLVVEIGGHTDSKGDDKFNQRLSEARAKSVVSYLVKKGIDKNRVRAKGYGETQPVAPNENADGTDNPEGREKNRRTELKVLKN